jgi:hypothetical protein
MEEGEKLLHTSRANGYNLTGMYLGIQNSSALAVVRLQRDYPVS